MMFPNFPFGGGYGLGQGLLLDYQPKCGNSLKITKNSLHEVGCPPENKSHLMTPEPQQMIPGELLVALFFRHCKSTLHIGESLEPKFQSFNPEKWWLRNWRMINLTMKKMVVRLAGHIVYNIYISISYYEFHSIIYEVYVGYESYIVSYYVILISKFMMLCCIILCSVILILRYTISCCILLYQVILTSKYTILDQFELHHMKSCFIIAYQIKLSLYIVALSSILFYHSSYVS